MIAAALELADAVVKPIKGSELHLQTVDSHGLGEAYTRAKEANRAS